MLDVSVAYKGSQLFDFTPDEGYEIEDVLVGADSKGVVSSYTVSNVTGDSVISVSYKLKTYEITASATGVGTETGTGKERPRSCLRAL